MEKLQLEDFLQYKYVSDVRYSPDGKHAAFVVHYASEDQTSYEGNIWVLHTETMKYRKLTGLQKERSFFWLDEETILFPAKRNPKEQERAKNGMEETPYYAISLHGGEAEHYFTVPCQVSGIRKLSDDNYLVLTKYRHNSPSLLGKEGAELEQALQEIREESDYEVFDEIPFWGNGLGVTNKVRNRLALYEKGSGTLTYLSPEYMNVTNFEVKEDGSQVVYSGPEFINRTPRHGVLYLYDVKEKSNTCLVPKDQFQFGQSFFLSDKILFSGAKQDRYGTSEIPIFYTVDLKTKEVALYHDPEMGISNTVSSDARLGSGQMAKLLGEDLYFITTLHTDSFLMKLSPSGEVQKLTQPIGSVDGFDLFDGKALFTGMRNQKLSELYEIDLVTGTENQITAFNEEILKKKTLSKPEYLSFTNSDGVKIEGYVMKPVGFDPEKRYPGILEIHGGPNVVYGDAYVHEMQLLANEGYFVFFCNPRGSSGRGNEFSDVRGKYGSIDFCDLMEFTDEVIKKNPGLDPERLGVAGGSYGGFMTNWIIGNTRRFKAACSQRSIANWVSKCLTTDNGYIHNMDQQGATPWTDMEKMWHHSPLKYADQVTTPTLFIHSNEDYRCWMAEGLQMFTALKYHDVPARLCLFKGENHELSRSGMPKHRVRRLREILTWFDTYLK